MLHPYGRRGPRVVERLVEYDLNALRIIRLAPEHDRPALAVGVAASPGVAVGQIALDPQVAVAMARDGCRPILVRHDISTDDLLAVVDRWRQAQDRADPSRIAGA